MQALSGIQNLTRADLDGPKGPFLLEVLMSRGKYAGDIERQWVLLHSVQTTEQALAVASAMSQAYQYRLTLEPGDYLFLDWQDDENADTCSPVWVRR